MSKKIFNDKDIQKLQENPYAPKGITYTDEFKRLFIAENEGKTSGQIFSEQGFDVEMIGNKRVQSSSKRWRDAYRKRGIAGLQDNRKDNSGRPSEKKLSAEEN